MADTRPRRKGKLVLLTSGIVATGVLLAVLLATAVLAFSLWTARNPESVGNWPRITKQITSTTDPDRFTFTVIGDAKEGTATFEKLLGLALEERPDFLIVPGDFVGHPDPARHRLFWHEMDENVDGTPILLVPGNHDIHPDKAFRVEDFEQVYGPAQFHFTIGEYLFIFLNNAPGYAESGEYLRYMDKVLSEEAGRARRVFIVLHVPPADLSNALDRRALAGTWEFRALLEKHRVDTVICSDHHGYWQGRRDGVDYIVTGGGGARLRGRRGKFHHAVRFSVADGKVSHSVIAVEKQLEILEKLEIRFATHVWPLLTGSWLVGVLGVALLVCSAAGFVACVARLRRRYRSPV